MHQNNKSNIADISQRILDSNESERQDLLNNTSLLNLEKVYDYLYEDSQSLYKRMCGADARNYIWMLQNIKNKIGMLDIDAVHYLVFTGFNPASGSGMTFYDFIDNDGKTYSFEGMFAIKEGNKIRKGDKVKVYVSKSESAVKMINLGKE